MPSTQAGTGALLGLSDLWESPLSAEFPSLAALKSLASTSCVEPLERMVASLPWVFNSHSYYPYFKAGETEA